MQSLRDPKRRPTHPGEVLRADRTAGNCGVAFLCLSDNGSQKVKPEISFVPRILTPSERNFLRQDLKNTIAEARTVKV